MKPFLSEYFLLQTDEFCTRGILARMNVKVVCTTDDPADSLAYHQQIKEDQSFSIKILPTFRPDQALAVETPEGFNRWVGRLEAAADMEINIFAQFLEGIQKRHDFFHQIGCRISDHGLEQPVAEPYSVQEITAIFDMVRRGQGLSPHQILKFKSAMLIELARMDAEKQWAQQFHLGALRNTNSRAMQLLGPDSGYDSMGDFEMANFRRVLCNLLGTDAENGELPDDMTLLGKMVKDICWYNAVNYFDIELPKQYRGLNYSAK